MTGEIYQELSTSSERKVLQVAFLVDYLGVLLMGLSSLRLTEIVDALNDASRFAVPVWYLSDFLGPALAISLLASSAANTRKTLAGWAVAFSLLYIVWQSSKSVIASVSPWWTIVFLAALLLLLGYFKPDMTPGTLIFDRMMVRVSESEFSRKIFWVWRFLAFTYGAFLFGAIVTIFRGRMGWAVWPLSLVELVSSTTITFTMYRITSRVSSEHKVVLASS